MDSGVLKPDKDVMSEFAPLAAAPRVARPPEGVPAPVPPRVTGSRPLEMLAALNPVKAEPSPLKPPPNRLAGWVSMFTPVKLLVPVSDAPPRLTNAFGAVLAPLPP